MFNPWTRDLPDTIEVCAVHLPGRESRLREPRVEAMSELAQKLVEEIDSSRIPGVFAIYGHSIGALIAFEFTRELRRRGKPLPVHLFVSGHRAPQCPPLPSIYQLNDREFLAELTSRYGGIPEPIRADPEALSFFLRIVRSDVQLMDTYDYREEPALTMPISAYGSNRDVTLTASMIEAWRKHTNSDFHLRIFEGGHFFPEVVRLQLLHAIMDDLGHLAS
jgi:medium-chain acyl-[acyl-carrier-protein] hydrolase